MGEIGMNLFQQFLEKGPGAFADFGGGGKGRKRSDD